MLLSLKLDTRDAVTKWWSDQLKQSVRPMTVTSVTGSTTSAAAVVRHSSITAL